MDAPWTPIYIAIMFIFHPLFGISAAIAAIISIFLAVITQKATADKLQTASNITSKANVSFQSNLRNSEIIYGMGMESKIHERSGLNYGEACDMQALASTAAGRLTAISKSFRLVAQSLLLGQGAYLVLIQAISPGVMIAGSLLLGRALAPIDMMVGQWKGFVDARSRFETSSYCVPSKKIEKLTLPAPLGQLSLTKLSLFTRSNVPRSKGLALNYPGDHSRSLAQVRLAKQVWQELF